MSRWRPRSPARWRSATATPTAAGEIGIIASVSRPFCGDCNRARLSADGQLYTCLFATSGHDLRSLLRGGASDEELEAAIRDDLGAHATTAIRRSDPLRPRALPKVEMSYIGG